MTLDDLVASVVQLSLPMGLAAVMTGALCHFAAPIGRVLGLLDDPLRKSHSNHSAPTPLVGGIAALLPMILVDLTGGPVASPLLPPGYWEAASGFGITLALLLLIGCLDDRLQLSSGLRLLITGTTFAVLSILYPPALLRHLAFPFLEMSVVLGMLSIPFTVLLLTAVVNSVNMADGRNGLVIGLCLIWTLALLSRVPGPAPVGMAMLITSLSIVLVYNLRGKLFLGDGGTYGLGAFFALSAVSFHNIDPVMLTTGQGACLFAIPLIDMVRLILERWKDGRSPMAADREHLHHYLDRRFGWRTGLRIYLGLVALPIAIAFSGPMRGSLGLLAAGIGYWAVMKAARDFAPRAARVTEAVAQGQVIAPPQAAELGAAAADVFEEQVASEAHCLNETREIS